MTQRIGNVGCWVPPIIPVFLLLGNPELVYWTDICLFRLVFCNYVPAGLTGSNNMLLSSANITFFLRLLIPGIGGALLD